MHRCLVATLLLAAALVLVGCGGANVEVDGLRVRESRWNATLAELRPRAAFDLACDPDAIDFTLFHLADGRPVEVGAAGCGGRLVYSRPNVGGYVSDNWFAQPSPPVADP